MEGISDASDQQASSSNQVTQGIDQISSVVQTNSATAEESAAASEELSGQAQMLKNLVGKFQLLHKNKRHLLATTQIPFMGDGVEPLSLTAEKY